MAFALTNKTFFSPEDAGVPAAHFEVADESAATSHNSGIANLKWIRGRVLIKSGLTNTQTVRLVVRVGTGATVTSPEVVATSPIITFVTGDTNLMWDFFAYSQAGFQSWNITPTNVGGTASYDIMVDCG